jgi:hypothetical protein
MLGCVNCLASSARSCTQVVFLPGTESWHLTGYQAGSAWAASVQNATNNYLTYGPYYQAAAVRVLLCNRYFELLSHSEVSASHVGLKAPNEYG